MEPEIIAQGAAVAHDFSLIALFEAADWVVKSVIVILLLCSFWSWAIIIDKFFRFRRLRSQSNKFEDVFWSGKSLDDLLGLGGGIVAKRIMQDRLARLPSGVVDEPLLFTDSIVC